MDATTAQFQCPLGHSKILHLLRHAQGIHNVAGEKDHSALLSPEFFDAPLSPLGCQQVTNLRNYVLASGLLKRIDLVITSPLLRSMQTAVEIFGSEESGLERPPIVAIELCRERLGVHPCDKRRTICQYRNLFPEIDFSWIESDDDILWKADVRETSEEIAARGLKFMNWLWTRQEREIAVVSHSKFLLYTLSALPIDCHPSLRSEICKQFENCELRSLMMVDKRMVAVTNKYLPVSSEEGNIRKHESQLQAYP
ncbi:phosphoglycerate mutase-like protein 1 isoform X2 [Hevea brasiliensis]|uniref:phosphoglycerate mutase-like protein 1 isoform X2 n=1 Tax=Hevea brasiliensis TaxID=3981 RepID=UPI0025D5863C|nr:phosphoglycerate mutase-like protein 1 isoform X2 [Hevea brasiliensis]